MTVKDPEFRSFWRIARQSKKYSCTDLSGSGGLYVGGRWHTVGTPVVYAATTTSLCCLETLVHYDASGLPVQRRLVELKIPTDCIESATHAVPPLGWDSMPDSSSAAATGSTWLSAGTSLLMFVPSVIIRQELNVLINPRHPDVARIQAIDHGSFDYDPRLIGRSY